MWKYLPASVCSAATGAMTSPSGSRESKPGQSATLNGTSTVSPSLRPVSGTVSLTMPPSGTMSESSTDSRGVDEWISSLPLRPANPTQVLATGRELAMIETSSPIHSESLAKYSPEESIWRTSTASQLRLKMDDQPTPEPWSENWPRSGMTVGGTLYQRRTLAHRTSESAGGSLPNFPTPRAIYGEHPGMKDPSHLPGAAMQWNTPNTPNTMDSLNCKSQDALNHEYTTARPGRKNPNNLRDQVAVQEGLRLWPTPSSGGDSGGPHGIRGGSWAKAKLVENVGEAEAVAMSGGQLSATWVCWLMGIPLGWDSLEPLPEGAYEEWAEHMEQGTWWAEERGLPRLAEGQKDRVNRLKMLGNGIVPASGALAFMTLEGEA